MRGEVDHNLNDKVREQTLFQDEVKEFISQFIGDNYENLLKDAEEGVKKYTDMRNNHFQHQKREAQRKKEELEKKA